MFASNMSVAAVMFIFCFLIFYTESKSNFPATGGKKSYSIRGTRMVCKHANPKFLHNLTCSAKPISRSEEVINASGTLHPNITIKTIDWRMKMYLKFGTVFRPMMVDVQVDACGLYRGLKYEFIQDMKLDAEDENIREGCPISGTRFVRNLRLRKDLYPNILPEGEARLDNIIYTRDNGKVEKLLTCELYFNTVHNDTQIF